MDVGRSLVVNGTVAVEDDASGVRAMEIRWPEGRNGEPRDEPTWNPVAVRPDGTFTVSWGCLDGELWVLLPSVRPLSWMKSPLSPEGALLRVHVEGQEQPVLLEFTRDEDGALVVTRLPATTGAAGSRRVVGDVVVVTRTFEQARYVTSILLP